MTDGFSLMISKESLKAYRNQYYQRLVEGGLEQVNSKKIA